MTVRRRPVWRPVYDPILLARPGAGVLGGFDTDSSVRDGKTVVMRMRGSFGGGTAQDLPPGRDPNQKPPAQPKPPSVDVPPSGGTGGGVYPGGPFGPGPLPPNAGPPPQAEPVYPEWEDNEGNTWRFNDPELGEGWQIVPKPAPRFPNWGAMFDPANQAARAARVAKEMQELEHQLGKTQR